MQFIPVITSVSHDPSEIIPICWFAAQETFLIINVKNSCAASYFRDAFFLNSLIRKFKITAFIWNRIFFFLHYICFYWHKFVEILLLKTHFCEVKWLLTSVLSNKLHISALNPPECLVPLTSIISALQHMWFTRFYKLRVTLALFYVVIDRKS